MSKRPNAKPLQINGKWYVEINCHGKRHKFLANSLAHAESWASEIREELLKTDTAERNNMAKLMARVFSPSTERTPLGATILLDSIPPALSPVHSRLMEFTGDVIYIYFLCNGPEVTYVGVTKALRTRSITHKRNGIEFDRVLYLIAGPEEDAYQIENALIQTLQPRFNSGYKHLKEKRRRAALKPVGKFPVAHSPHM